MIEDFSMRCDGCLSQITACEAGFLMAQKVVEYLATGPPLERQRESMSSPVAGELVSETEGACNNLRLDASEVYARASDQVCADIQKICKCLEWSAERCYARRDRGFQFVVTEIAAKLPHS